VCTVAHQPVRVEGLPGVQVPRPQSPLKAGTRVEVIDKTGETPYGRLGWAVDPEGNRFELRQPPPGR
jgi:hypothetical protein